MSRPDWNEPAWSALVGHTVASIYVSDDEGAIVMVTDRGAVTLNTDGDCCSQTWFADITDIDNLRGHTIVSAENINVPDSYNIDDGRGRQEEDSAYGLRITTEAGTCDIIYRNSSNGYYGGSGWAEAGGDVAMMKEIIGDEWSA